MWRLWWKVELIDEMGDHSDNLIAILRYTPRFFFTKYLYPNQVTGSIEVLMDAEEVMKYDWNKREYENENFKN